MLKVGVIGSVGSVLSHVRQIRDIPGIQVVGKSSVGMVEQSDTRFLTIPEINRQELINTADILVVDQTSLIYPDLLIFAIKNNKHLFINDFPDLSPDACLGLLKLSEEARSAIHVRNPLCDEPLTRWSLQNRRDPLYLSLFEIMPQLPDKRLFLIRNLFYATSLFDAFPLKIRTAGIHPSGSSFYFINIRLEYPAQSTFNLELLIQPCSKSHLKVIMPGKFLDGESLEGRGTINGEEKTHEFTAGESLVEFLRQAESGNPYALSNINSYHSALQTLRDVLRKIELYTPWQ